MHYQCAGEITSESMVCCQVLQEVVDWRFPEDSFILPD